MCVGCGILWILLLASVFVWVMAVGIPWLVEYQTEQDSRDQLAETVRKSLGMPKGVAMHEIQGKFLDFARQANGGPAAPTTRPACTEPIDSRTGPR